jgi:hypothetical protein
MGAVALDYLSVRAVVGPVANAIARWSEGRSLHGAEVAPLATAASDHDASAEYDWVAAINSGNLGNSLDELRRTFVRVRLSRQGIVVLLEVTT